MLKAMKSCLYCSRAKRLPLIPHMCTKVELTGESTQTLDGCNFILTKSVTTFYFEQVISNFTRIKMPNKNLDGLRSEQADAAVCFMKVQDQSAA